VNLLPETGNDLARSDSSRQIKLGALISYLAIAINILTGLIYTPWMIRVIGRNNYGLYVLASSLISMFMIDFGMSAAVSRFISKYNAEGDQQSVNNFLGIIYKLYFVIDLAVLSVLVAVYIFIDTIYLGLTPAELGSFKVVYIIAATFNVISFPFITLNGLLISYEKFIKLKACDLFNKLFTVFLIVLALLSGFGLYALVFLNAIGGLVTIAVKLLIIKRKIAVKVNFRFKSKAILKDIFSFSIWSTLESISARLIFNITPSILGMVADTGSIAVFGIVNILEGYVFIFANAINGLFLPKVSRMVAKKNNDSHVLQLMIKIGRIQLVILTLIMVGFIAVGKEFILLWLGKGYLTVYYCTIVIILPSLISLPQEIANIAIIALNKVKLKSYVSSGTAIANVVLSIILSRFWGAFGASLAIGISAFIRCVGMNFVYYKVLHLDIFRFFKECHLKMAVPLVIALTIGIGVNYLIHVADWRGLMVKGGMVVAAYVILVWRMHFNELAACLNIKVGNR
jgi:O-antigen/teichoic acid export membrane protein